MATLTSAETKAGRLTQYSGAALGCGGLVTVALNLVLTPLMPTDAPFAATASSSVYLWRQGASALAAGLLLFGSIGLFLRQGHQLGMMGFASFVAAFFGSALLLAWEWVDVFVLRSFALVAPEALASVESTQGIDLYDLGALIPISLFSIGWLAFAAVTFRSRVFPRLAPGLVILGFFLTPALTALLGMWGAGVGSAVLGAGWIWLGVATASRPSHRPTS